MKKSIYYYVASLVSVTILSLSLASCGGGTQAPKLTPTTASVSKHQLKGFENCQSCHATGTRGAPKNPAGHAEWTNDQCLLCHNVK